jgi:hypothetical protein
LRGLDAEQRRPLSDFRSALARTGPQFVVPSETIASIGDYGELSLVVPHSRDADIRIELHFGDGYLVLVWPGGRGHGRLGLAGRMGCSRGAILSGRNRQTVYRALGRAAIVETEFRDERGVSRVVRSPRLTRLQAVLLRPFSSRSRRSVSFDRSPAVEF